MALVAMELFERLEWWLEGLMLFVTAVLGLLGNLIFIAVFTCNRRNLNTFHRSDSVIHVYLLLSSMCIVNVLNAPLFPQPDGVAGGV